MEQRIFRVAYSESPLDLPGRHPSMTALYIAKNHPFVEGVAGVGTVYVGIMKTDLRSMRNAYNFEKNLVCPKGGRLEWEEQGQFSTPGLYYADSMLTIFAGLLELLDGGYYFLRDPSVSGDPSDDVLAVMVTGKSVIF